MFGPQRVRRRAEIRHIDPGHRVPAEERSRQPRDFGQIDFGGLSQQIALRVRREFVEIGEDLTLAGLTKGGDELLVLHHKRR